MSNSKEGLNDSATAPVGKCEGMCPVDEIKLRECEGLLHTLEIAQGTEKLKRPKADKEKIVKMFSRPAAGRSDPKPKDLRPPEVLHRTVIYLVQSVLPSKQLPWNEVYDFVFDRFRAVRQDMVIQRLMGKRAVDILEIMVRFHIYAAYRLCEESVFNFDKRINEEHCQECLKRLLYLYTTLDSSFSNRAEMESLYLLFNLGNADAIRHALNLPKSLRQSEPLQMAFRVTWAYLQANYVRVVRLVKKLEFLQACAVHQHLISIQRDALRRMSVAYHSKACRYPLDHLGEILGIGSTVSLQAMCQQCGLTVQDGKICFQRGNFKEQEKNSLYPLDFIDSMLSSKSVMDILVKDNG
ncbi:SAC3 domain-containing protein 1 [Lingula anatina]|uniref:SAC3 domain-containing protein 1 n=1 Tax=Lingula anatina TaxID=7574 RepID=A0A1S3ISE2_LINAN|nr:SAC3 domain-containing protein 1 [Lingula anatina]|eukprot:XP_013400454.1 SAC3 domain-containing protein 1 [Lingula anatina]